MSICKNTLDFVEVTSLDSKDTNGNLKFLIDTGANVSLIKACKLRPETRFNSQDKLVLHGLSPNNSVETVGSCCIPLKIHERTILAKFYIINQATNVPFDGLIGKDILERESATIDYESRSITFKTISATIPLVSQNCDDAKVHLINLKARTETLIEIEIKNPEIQEGIIPEVKLRKGLYLCKAITKVNENNRAYATILNTRVIDQQIETISVCLEQLPKNSTILSLNSGTPTSSRVKLLQESLRLGHLNSDERKSVLDICTRYQEIFYFPDDKLSATNAIEHEIHVTDPTPIYTKSYRYPEVHKPEVQKQIEKMLNQGIIQPSISPWSSPLWIVPKKIDASGKKKWRIVIDFRQLNNVTVGDAYPIPNIDEILDQLGHSKYFTTLDLASGFHQIPMGEQDRRKTAFTTPLGHYEFTRMPFGLKNAPATFQRLMNTVLSGLQGLQCFVYLDDIVIYASSITEHSEKLKAIFERLAVNNLKLQPDKCEFMRHEVAYLGHVISEKGVQPNPDKINAIANYPSLRNQKDIKVFLGLIGYYRKFIQDFAKLAKPLTILLKKDMPFEWGTEQQDSFDKFKQILTHQPILQYPDFNREFILTTDASNHAIGSVLSQGSIGSDLPIAYASRTLNGSEQNYNTTEKGIACNSLEYKPF